MFLDNVNDNELCKLIYKASFLLYPKYSSLFNGDCEEFQQLCAVLILPKLKKYDKSKGALSTYVYNFLPMAVNNWYCRSKESKELLNEVNKLRVEDLVDDVNECRLFTDTIDIPRELKKKDINKVLNEIREKYPFFRLREEENLTFRQIGSKLNTNERRAKYLYWKELMEIRNTYGDLLKSLSV